MKTSFVVSLALFAGATGVFADVLNSGASAATSTAFNPTGSFWNNNSSDVVNGSSAVNVGNFLNDTGAFALNGNVTLGCSTCGVNYMASGGQMYVNNGNTPDFVNNLNFVKQAGGVQITLLYANDSANSLASFGLYDASNTANTLLLQGAGTNLNTSLGTTYTSGTLFAGATNLGTYDLSGGSPYANWGLFATMCTENAASVSQCSTDGDLVTYFMGALSALNAGQTPFDTAHEHFALFQAGTNANQYYAGVESFAFTAQNPTSSPTEGYGDFNDLIFGVTTSIQNVATPEPGTIGIMGLGLAGLGILGRRFRK